MDKGFERWLKQKTAPSKSGVFGFLREDLQASGKLKDKWSGGKKWQGEQLKPLSIKKYGRSYESKFNSAVKELGIPESERQGFREWLNNKESENVIPAYFQHNLSGNIKEAKKARKTENKRQERAESSVKLKQPTAEDRRKEREEKKKADKREDMMKFGINTAKGTMKAKDALGGLMDFLKKGSQANQQEDFTGAAGLIEASKRGALDKGILPESFERFDARLADSQSMGLMKNLALRDLKDNPTPEKQAEYDRLFGESSGGKQTASDIIAELLGYASPGALGSMGIRAGAKMLGKEMGKGSLKKSAKEIAAEGAVLGGGMAGAEVGIREALNPEDTNWKENLAHIGLGVGAGAALDPLISLAGPAAKALLRRSADDIGTRAATEQIQNALRSGEYTPIVPPRADGRTSYSPLNSVEDILTGRTKSLQPSATPKTELRQVGQVLNPDASFDTKMEYFRNKKNPITENEIPHVMNMMQELESRVANLRNDPNVHAEIAKLEPRYATLTEEMANINNQRKNIVENMEIWNEVKRLQELYRPANRPEYYKFKIPDNVKEDFADVPKRFRSAQNASMHIDEAATAAGYDNIDEFVRHLQQLDSALATKRKDLLPDNKVIKDLDSNYQTIRQQQDEIFNEFTGIRDMESQIEELAGYMKPREAELEVAATQTVDAPDPRIAEEPTVQAPKLSPLGATGRAVRPYEGTGMAPMPKVVDRVADRIKGMPEEVSKFRENWDSSIQAAKDLEKYVTKNIQERNIRNVLRMLPEGNNKRVIAFEDNFAKQLQAIPKSVAMAVRSYQKGYGKVFDTLKKNGIKRETFEEYALAKHAQDIYKSNADKVMKRNETLEQLEALEKKRIGVTDTARLRELDRAEAELSMELDALEPYKLPRDMTEERANQIVSQTEKYTGMKEAHEIFLKEQRKDLQMLYESGQHSKAEIEAMMKAHPNYVSLKRNVPDSTNIFNYVGKKNASTPIKARGTGSEEYDILPVLDSAFNNRLDTYNAVARNDAIRTLERWAKVDGMEDLVRRVEPSDPNFANVVRNTLKGYSDGKEIYLEVPPVIREMMDATSGINPDVAMKLLKGIATAYKAGTTHWNPQFHVNAALRDTTQALANSRTDAKMRDMFAGFLDSFMGPQLHKLSGGRFNTFREVYKDLGGDMSGLISRDMYSVHRITEAVRKGSLDGKPVLNPLRLIEGFGMKMEHGARLGEFRSAKRKGYSDEDAAFEATDIIDYSDQGRIAKKINPYDPYLTATIRGNVRTLQAMKNNPKQFTKVGLTFVTLPTVVLYGMRYSPTTSDEQRAKIENMPKWQKETFWAIPIPFTETIALMPKPFILGQAFANPVERALDRAFTDSNKTVAQDVVDTALDIKNVGMPPMSLALASTVIELSANKDLFTGYDIESQSMQNQPKDERYDSYTSEIAKKIGAVTGNEAIPEEVQLSPAQVDHALRKAGGTLGSRGLNMLDNIFAQLGERPARPETAAETLNPLGSLLYKDTSASGLYGRIMKEAKKDDKQWLADNPDKHRMPKKDRPKTASQEAYEELKTLNDEIKAIREDMDLTSKEKRELISELRTQQKLIGSEWLKNN